MKRWWDRLGGLSWKYAEVNRRGLAAGVLLIPALLIFMKALPKGFGFRNGTLLGFLILDCLLCLSLAIRWKIPRKWEGYFAALLLFGAPALCFFHMEYLQENPIRYLTFLVVFFNYLFYLFVFWLLYILTNRVRVAVPAGMLLFTVYTLVNRFVCLFRGNGIRSYDIYALQTAMNVSDNYYFVFSKPMVLVILSALAMALISVQCRWKDTRIRVRAAVDAGMLAFMIFVCSRYYQKPFLEKTELAPYVWEVQMSAVDHGTFLDFVTGLAYLNAEKPEGYSAAQAEEIRKNAHPEGESLTVETGLDGEKPDIIVVMNESFADLDRLGELSTTADPLENFYRYPKNAIRGNLSVPVFGGMTANTEYEFLTGYSNAFFPNGIIPFQAYVKESTPNLGRQLARQGYETIFMHPFSSTGWNRPNVYRMFGFDAIHFYEDFAHKEEKVRSLVSDSGNYKDLFAWYEEAAKDGSPVFLYDVTMQNHGGYEAGMEPTVRLKGREGEYPKAEEYLTLLRESDRAYRELVDYFMKVDRPVLVCMFGDHLPKIEEELLQELAESGGGTQAEQTARKHQTPFVIFANYEIEEKELEHLGVNYLSTLLLEAADLPLSEYQEYLKRLYEIRPVVSVNGALKEDGSWISWEDVAKDQEVLDYQIVQYQEVFG